MKTRRIKAWAVVGQDDKLTDDVFGSARVYNCRPKYELGKGERFVRVLVTITPVKPAKRGKR